MVKPRLFTGELADVQHPAAILVPDELSRFRALRKSGPLFILLNAEKAGFFKLTRPS